MTAFKMGFLISVATLCSIGIVVVLAVTLFAYNFLYNAIDQCNTAVYQSVDFAVIKAQNQMKFTDASSSLSFFEKALQNSLDLDNNLKPTSSTPPLIAGEIEVVSLEVKNEGAAATLGKTSLNVNSAVRSVVKVPIKIPGYGVYMSKVDVLTILPISY